MIQAERYKEASTVMKIVDFGLNKKSFSKTYTMKDSVRAENILYRKAQADIYPDEIKNISTNEELTRL